MRAFVVSLIAGATLLLLLNLAEAARRCQAIGCSPRVVAPLVAR